MFWYHFYSQIQIICTIYGGSVQSRLIWCVGMCVCRSTNTLLFLHKIDIWIFLPPHITSWCFYFEQWFHFKFNLFFIVRCLQSHDLSIFLCNLLVMLSPSQHRSIFISPYIEQANIISEFWGFMSFLRIQNLDTTFKIGFHFTYMRNVYVNRLGLN